MISRDIIDGFTETLNSVAETAKQALRRRLERIDLSDPDRCVDLVSSIMEDYASRYADQTAEMACRFYDQARLEELGEEISPTPNPLYNQTATRDATHGILYKYSDAAARLDMLVNRLDYEFKRAAANAVIAAGDEDKNRPRFARVTTGAETCLFCLMLAANGFYYRTARTAGDDGHYHPNCDCRIVPSWKGAIEGYDPKACYKKWQKLSEEKAVRMAENQAKREGLVWSELSESDRAERVKAMRAHEKKRLADSSKRAKQRRKEERIAAGEIVRVGGNRGPRGAGSRSYLKYGMTREEWLANGRKPK